MAEIFTEVFTSWALGLGGIYIIGYFSHLCINFLFKGGL